MTTEHFHSILATIAQTHGSTVQEVYDSMQEALSIAQQSTDPTVQAKWRCIPRKGAVVTVEEFLSYFTNP